MSIVNWLFYRKTKIVAIELPTPVYHALETCTYMQNNARSENNQLRQDDIVTLALAEYFQKNLYTNTVDDFRVVTQISSREVPYSTNVRKLPSGK